MADPKRTLFIFRQPPYKGTLARDGLEMALAMGALGQPCEILFLNQGVLQLRVEEPPVGMKNHSAMLAALPMYDIQNCWVTSEALAAQGLAGAELAVECKSVAMAKLDEFYARFDHRISF